MNGTSTFIIAQAADRRRSFSLSSKNLIFQKLDRARHTQFPRAKVGVRTKCNIMNKIELAERVGFCSPSLHHIEYRTVKNSLQAVVIVW